MERSKGKLEVTSYDGGWTGVGQDGELGDALLFKLALANDANALHLVKCWNAFEEDGLVGELVDELRNSESCLRELSKAIKGGVLDSQSVLLGTNKRAWNLAKEYAESAKAVLAKAAESTP